MEFRVKDLLITSIVESPDPWCGLWTGPLCCCVGWTANGTTQEKGVALTASHLEALRTEIKGAVAPAGAEKATADDAALAALESKLSEALEAVRSQRKKSKP